MMNIYDHLKAKGISIPELTRPVASYVPARISGNLIFASGQTGTADKKLVYKGKLGRNVTIDEGKESARLAMLNCLAEIEHVLGDLNRVEEIIKVTGYVASGEGFVEQPAVIEGASRLLLEIFGDRGQHARAAVGVAELPSGAPVEVEVIARIKD